MLAGDRNGFGVEGSEWTINHVEMEEGKFGLFGGESGAVLCAFEVGGIWWSCWKVVHAFVESGMSGDLDLVGTEVIPKDILPCFGVAKEDSLSHMVFEL